MEYIIKAPESSGAGSPISPFYWGNKGWHWEGSNLRKDSLAHLNLSTFNHVQGRWEMGIWRGDSWLCFLSRRSI